VIRCKISLIGQKLRKLQATPDILPISRVVGLQETAYHGDKVHKLRRDAHPGLGVQARLYILIKGIIRIDNPSDTRTLFAPISLDHPNNQYVFTNQV
jgi:hypothetical protein